MSAMTHGVADGDDDDLNGRELASLIKGDAPPDVEDDLDDDRLDGRALARKITRRNRPWSY